MDVLTLLEQARSAGLTVTVRGDKLIVRGPRRAGALAEHLLSHKAEVLNALALETLTPADLPADWHFRWDERAAIMEYDAGLPRERAEALALADTLDRMRRAGCLPNYDACNNRRLSLGKNRGSRTSNCRCNDERQAPST